MTPQDFFNKYNGKGIDFDGAYGDQCMDLMNQFSVEVWGDTSGQLRAPTAYQSWLKNSPDYEKIHYQLGKVPQEGDIIYWSDQYIKGTGHVAVATNKGNQSVFTSFDQNFPLGSKCHYQEHTYNGVVGWKRRKRQQNNQPIEKPIESSKTKLYKYMDTPLFAKPFYEKYKVAYSKPGATAKYFVMKTNDKDPKEVLFEIPREDFNAVMANFRVAGLEYKIPSINKYEESYLNGLTKSETPFSFREIMHKYPSYLE